MPSTRPIAAARASLIALSGKVNYPPIVPGLDLAVDVAKLRSLMALAFNRGC
jgi:hypothetical protein